MPVYNSSKYLDESIQSVIDQTYKNWELIIVDDESIDDSIEIINRYVGIDSRIKLFQQKNAGQGKARNLGIIQSKGDLIAFLDSDDIWQVNKLLVQKNSFDTFKCDLIFTAGFKIYEEDSNKKTPFLWKSGIYYGNDFFKIITESNFVVPSSVVVKKIVLMDVGLFDESIIVRGSEDFDLWMKIAHSGKYAILGLEEKLVLYRIRAAGEHKILKSQFYGKLYVFEKYISRGHYEYNLIIKHYRYFYRELLDLLCLEGNSHSVQSLLRKSALYDTSGIVIKIQNKLIQKLPLKWFNSISNRILYPISFKFQNLFRW